MPHIPPVAFGGQLYRAQVNAALDYFDGEFEARETSFGFLADNYALSNSTSVQKLFNWTPSGALTLPTGVYLFKTLFSITGMSSTAGNGAFSIAGTATLGRIVFSAVGNDDTNPNAAGARSGSAATTATSQEPVLSDSKGTGMILAVDGLFSVTVAGTIIPSFKLTVASAATVLAGSYFMVQRFADIGSAYVGDWS